MSVVGLIINYFAETRPDVNETRKISKTNEMKIFSRIIA